MRPDVIALRSFYRRPPGSAAAGLLARRVRMLWPSLAGQHLAGIGFATPLLDLLGDDMASRVALMPAAQGVMHWPDHAHNVAALVEEQALPLPDGAFDRVILMHAVELADNLRELLQETWRILAPGGRLIAIVPRRRGLWSGSESTPFGSGRPFSRHQLAGLLADHLLPVTRTAGSLYLPPLLARSGPRALVLAERFLAPTLPGLGGILIVESEKQVYRPVLVGGRKLARRPALVGKPRLAPGAVSTRKLGKAI